ncbi:alpha/beta-hydrolase [Xylariaceae sp. FL0016]|nr:alpha/beta-hydrolase [Xylariaceae sp. FL0016]
MLHLPVLVAVIQFIRLTLAVQTTVDLACHKYVGVQRTGGITQWLGMQYAAAPVGDLRFEPPQDPPCNSAAQVADTRGKMCLKTGADPTDSDTSEDCLYLDVFAPTNATRNSRMPVFFFIQGGGFNSMANAGIDGTGLITASGHSIVIVTFSYRVGPYGFITDGDQITPNNGLMDQRKALEWVKENIAQFGGDPDHVVLGGDSAGAASISLQMAAYGGKSTDLFHAAAAESVSFATVLTVEESQYQYDYFAIQVGCAGNSSLACIKSKTSAELQAANMDLPPYPGAGASPLYMWNPVIDGDMITDLTYNLYAEGKFVKIPAIYGDDTNGGTIFTPKDTSTIGESDAFLKDQFPYLTLEQLGEINDLFPNTNDTCPNTGCYWRQVSDAYGNMRYMCPTVYIVSEMANHGARAYSYRYNVEDPEQIAEGLGVPHTVELNAVFGPEYMGPDADPPASYYRNGTNAAVVPVVQAYWASFIRSFDPNKYRYPGSAIWEVWSPQAQDRLLFETGGKTRMETVDAATKARCEYFWSIGAAVRQ